jgi:hypothetical protein
MVEVQAFRSAKCSLILRVRIWPESEVVYETTFAGNPELTACDTTCIVTEMNQFHVHSDLYLHKMAMFASDGVSRVLGKKNGVGSNASKKCQ